MQHALTLHERRQLATNLVSSQPNTNPIALVMHNKAQLFKKLCALEWSRSRVRLHHKTLKEWTVKQLIAHAKRHKVSYSGLRKAQLFEKLCALEKSRG